MSEIWQMPATELAQRIAKREMSSVEVVNAHLARIDAVNPALNAIVKVLRDEARAEAAAAMTSLHLERSLRKVPCLMWGNAVGTAVVVASTRPANKLGLGGGVALPGVARTQLGTGRLQSRNSQSRVGT